MTVDSLTERRDAAATAYYEGESIMSDDEFDQLEAELTSRGIEETVGHGYIPAGKVAHERRMLSIAKVHTSAEVAAFIDRTGAADFDVQLKYDGQAVSLRFDRQDAGGDPILTRAVTRGTGDYGEDVTYAVRQMIEVGALPGRLAQGPRHEELRGEIILNHDDLLRLNAASGGKYSNERNAAAGILRRQSGDEARYLSLTIHDNGSMLATRLSELGFTTADAHFYRKVHDLAGIMAAVTEVDFLRKTLNFDTDGVVIKVSGATARSALGESSTSPNWAIAFKFPSEVKQTILRDVQWQLGRTGKLTPVAVFDSVVLTKANVTQATLHNIKFIADMGLRIGDTLEVTRSGEVIPYVLGRVGNPGDGATIGEFTTWTARDGNEYPVERDGVNLRVVGYIDPVTTIVYGIQTLGILGVSTSLVTKLVDAGIVATLADMLGVTAAQISPLDREGDQSAANAVAAIHDGLAGATVGKWFATIGVTGLGRTTGRILEERFGTLDAIASASATEVSGLEGFGDITTRDFLAARPRVQALADELRNRHGYVPAAATGAIAADSEFSGLNVVLTGSFPTLGRNAATDAARRMGANVQSSVSAKTDLLIAGEAAGSKLAKAQTLGVRIIPAVEYEAKVVGVAR